MVKEHKRRARSSSEESEDSPHMKKNRKIKRERSASPRARHKPSSHKSRHRSESPVYIKRHIKQEPDSSDSDHDHRRKQRVKKERNDRHSEYRGHREERHHHHRHEQRHRPVRVKEEPTDEENFRSQHVERGRHDERRRADRERRDRLPNDNQSYGRQEAEDSGEPQQPKDAPNFELSGKLTEDTNTYKGVVIKYNEPAEARKPKKRWRLYPFKNDEAMKPFHMHRQSAYLFGRDRVIADIPVDHPSCSKQHAVFQYRMVPYEKEDGRRAHKISPYIIDLGSANGTFVNNKPIEAQRYVELIEKDVLKFGFSSREYVLLHDRSATSDLEDD